MVKISRSFLTSTKNISETCTNLMMVYEVMKRNMEKSMEYKHSIYIKNLYTELRKYKVGTTTVESLCNRICAQLPKRRKVTLVNLIIGWKLADARNELRRTKYENTQEWRKCRRILQENNVLIAYERLWNREIHKYENGLNKKLEQKIQFLRTKYKKVDVTIPDNIGYIIFRDQELPPEFESIPRVYGDIEINEQEKSILSLPPKYTVYQKIDAKMCEAEVEKAVAKLRWESKKEEKDQPTTGMEFFDITNRTYDFAKFKSTDLPFNGRVILPPPLDDETEISLQNLKNELNRTTKEYTERNKIKRNLTQEQESGLASLIEKRNNGEVIIFETDKTKRFSCDSAANYRRAAEPHISGDETVAEETRKEYERQINAHTQMWTRILKAGKDVNNHDRIRNNMKSRNCPPAPLAILRKDHKEHESESIGPPGRPLCSGDISYNMRISHLMSIMLSEIHKEEESICSSTEELIAEIERINSEGTDTTFIVGSADVDALYPSLDIDFTIEKTCEMFMHSKVKYKNINYKEVSLYIALNRTREQIDTMDIKRLCPKRRSGRGPRPNITGCGTIIEEGDRYKPWIFPNLTNINDMERRKLLTEAVRIVLHTIMESHVYLFDNVMKKQRNGGAIGVQLTGEVAQIFMSWWDRQVKASCHEKGMEVKLYGRYVDDINTLIRKMEPGTRLVNNQLICTETGRTEDATKEDDEITMNAFKNVAETIHGSIKLKIDYPSKYEDRKIPILDLKVWVEETGDGAQIMYEHYEKEIASKQVVHANSAIPKRMKMTILTQEMLRILTHCSPNLPWGRICEHINRFIQKLQFSGYDKRFRFCVVDSALKAFGTIKQQAASGQRPINRPRNWMRQERQLETRRRRKEWYKRGGFESVLFVPPTPEGKLKRMCQERIMESGFMIKVVEKTGRKLKHLVQRTNPFKQARCERDNCFPCNSGSTGDCQKESITYQINCENEACTRHNVYNGETSYNGYTRGKEHLDDLERKNPKCALWRHCLEIHNGETQTFKMNVEQHFKNDAMLRQISEAVNINNTPADNVMNTRSEWNRPRVPHAQIT